MPRVTVAIVAGGTEVHRGDDDNAKLGSNSNQISCSSINQPADFPLQYAYSPGMSVSVFA